MRLLTRALLAIILLAAPGLARAEEIRAMVSGAMYAPFIALVPQFERATGHRVVTISASSMGGGAESIPARLGRGEVADLLVMAAPALDLLVVGGHAVPGSRVDLVNSLIGMSVRAGARRWDISTEEGFLRALREANSIAYSASASGTYFAETLLPRLGLVAEIGPKARRIVTERVGTIVARGEAELGMQQVSELIPIAGLDFLGVLPPSVQQATIFAAGIGANARQPEAARALIAFLRSAEVAPVIRAAGLEPIQ